MEQVHFSLRKNWWVILAKQTLHLHSIISILHSYICSQIIFTFFISFEQIRLCLREIHIYTIKIIWKAWENIVQCYPCAYATFFVARQWHLKECSLYEWAILDSERQPMRSLSREKFKFRNSSLHSLAQNTTGRSSKKHSKPMLHRLAARTSLKRK